jgi:GMP synthase-like glutamine amidotransferase
MKPVAIFRFSPTEGPGHFAEWLGKQGIRWQLIALDRAEKVPEDPRAFSGIGMMGGPMSANDALPWSEPLIALLRDAINADVPVIGHCLGGQILAKALGAHVRRTATPEIGWGDVEISDRAGAALFGQRERFRTFQWHHDVFGLPQGAKRVLTNRFNPEQAYMFGKHLGFQCHIEMTREMVETWCRSGADELPARSTGGTQSRADIFDDLDVRLEELSLVADDVYAHWARGLVPS